MTRTTKTISSVIGAILIIGCLFGFQVATDNTGGGMWTHIDFQAAGTCTAGAAGTVRVCGSGNALQASVNGAAPFAFPWNSSGLVDFAQMAPDALQQITPLTLTNSQVLGMQVTPVQVLAAQGAGTMIEVVSAVVEDLNAGVAYANGGVIALFYGSSPAAATEASTTLASTFLTSPTVTTYGILTPAGAALVGSTTANTALYISNLTAPFITGTGTVKVNLTYRVRTL